MRRLGIAVLAAATLAGCSVVAPGKPVSTPTGPGLSALASGQAFAKSDKSPLRRLQRSTGGHTVISIEHDEDLYWEARGNWVERPLRFDLQVSGRNNNGDWVDPFGVIMLPGELLLNFTGWGSPMNRCWVSLSTAQLEQASGGVHAPDQVRTPGASVVRTLKVGKGNRGTVSLEAMARLAGIEASRAEWASFGKHRLQVTWEQDEKTVTVRVHGKHLKGELDRLGTDSGKLASALNLADYRIEVTPARGKPAAVRPPGAKLRISREQLEALRPCTG